MNKSELYTIKPIAYVQSDYNEKFGIPRQPMLVPELKQYIEFAEGFRNVDALRGLEDFSHAWIIWGFSETSVDMSNDEISWSPTVRPPRLGGNVRKGVWATRSPYRPNSLAMSLVKIEQIELDSRKIYVDTMSGEVAGVLTLVVSGGDMMNGSPVYDIKPYLPETDNAPNASGGFTDDSEHDHFKELKVVFPEEFLAKIPEEKRAGLIKILSLDPRGMYEKKPRYTYGLSFSDYDIKFQVDADTLIVLDITS